MKKPHWLVRLAALTFSIVLVAGFVAYRAGAWDWVVRMRTGEARIMSGSKTAIHVIDPSVLPNATMPGSKSDVALPPHIMSGSKSLIVTPARTNSTQSSPPQTTILPGSKSAPIVIPPAPPQTEPKSPPNEPATGKPQTLLPGSKYGKLP